MNTDPNLKAFIAPHLDKIFPKIVFEGFGKATQSDIEGFERMLGCELGEDYKTFLLDYNGGTPLYNCLDMSTYNAKFKTCNIKYFFGFSENPDANLLIHFIKWLNEETISDGHKKFPIAIDEDGNYIFYGYGIYNLHRIMSYRQGSHNVADCINFTGFIQKFSYVNHQRNLSHAAILANDTVFLEKIVAEGWNPNFRYSFSETPLFIAIQQKNYPLAHYLLDIGARVYPYIPVSVLSENLKNEDSLLYNKLKNQMGYLLEEL